MSNQLKKKNTASGGLYIALAICILSVICIGVYSAVINIVNPVTSKNPTQQETKKEIKKTPSVIIEGGDEKTPSVTTPTVSRPEATLPSVDAPTVNKEPEEDVSVQSQPTPPTYTMPVAGNVTKPFSNDILVYSTTMNDYRVHNGVDIVTAVGTPVKAFTDGTVEAIYEDPLMGHTIVVDHGNNTKSYYSNLTSAFPEGIVAGKKVKEGEVIGGVGESILIECAEEPHLHFEVMVGSEYVDPMSYFQ
ncbi:MAG: M23 family metallopeptidase [Ruminococcaceae bacterium]|nr:M23 family metallopeptidase [Oscillospiraceae bacterium]